MIEAFIIIVIHFIADFICQDEKWAVGKSSSIESLLKHTGMYSLIWWICGLVYLAILGNTFPITVSLFPLFCFVLITFLAHTITDYFTSKQTSKLYAKGKFGSSIPNLGFFSMIGFDQVLHYAQLFLTYHFVTEVL